MDNSVKSESFVVFVTKFVDSKGVYKDEVIKTGKNRFKSIKFRHTSYQVGDFNTNIETLLTFTKQTKK